MFAPTYRSRTIAGLLSLTALVISLTCFVDFGVQSAGRSGDVEFLTNSLSGTDVVSRTSLIVNDIVYNPQDHKLYASRPGSAGPEGNSISGIDIVSGQVLSNVFIGSEPNRLALSGDGSVLHVGLDGSFGIRRYYTVTQEAGPQFSLGAQYNVNPYTAGDIAVTPGNANVIAVNRASYSSGGDIALFNEFGIKLPLVVSDSNPVPGTLAFSASPSVLYAAGLRTINVTDQGLVQADGTTFGVPRIKFDNGLIFSSIGQVVNPQTRTLLGTFPGASTNAFAPDTSVGRAYYAVRDTSGGSIVLKAFDVNTYVLIGSLTIPNVAAEPTTLVRCGTNGLALRTADGKLFLIQTSLIPTGDPLPTPTATPTVTPTPISSPYTVFMRRIGIPANDLVYLNSSHKILASIASSDDTRGNSVTEIDPQTGAIENSTFVGSEPGAMALTDDQQTLYVGLDGAGSVRKFDVPGRVPGEQFYLGTGSNGPLKAYRLAVRPGSTETVAVSTANGFDSPRIYDSGVMRPQIGNGSGPMTFSSADQIFISNSSSVLTRYTVWPTGAIMPQTVPAAASGNMVYAEGKIYFGNGRVVDASTNAIVGSFAGLGYYYTVAVDTASRRVFFFTNYQSGSGWRIVAYDMDTYRPIGTIPIQIFFFNQVRVFIRWGTNGLAFRDDYGNIYLIQSDLVGPGPVPTPTPTITPTPTPSPTNAPTFIRQVNLPANDVAYSESAQSLLVSVPGSAGPERGNTITRVDPVSGVVGLSAFVGSEPSKLALSDDGQTLYTKLDGAAGAIRRFDVAAGTPGLQFAGPPYWIDMKVMPGSPQTLAIASGNNNGGVAIFENGVQRPATSNGGAYGIYSIDFADAATLYGYDNYSSGYELVKFDVTANGVTGTNIGNGLISGGGRIKFSGGRIYSQYGRVVDPQTRSSVGTFNGGGDAMAVDPVSGRVFFIYNGILTAFDSSTFRKIGSTTLPGVTGTATSLVRWGENGLALRTTSGNSGDGRLYIIQSRLVSDTAVVPIGLQLSSPNYSVPEFISTLAVSITRTGDTTRPVSVKYSTSDGTATAGSDYTAVHGELAFAAGETTKTVSIPIINDNVYEGPETFNFSLIDENQPGVNIVYPQTASIVISDNDNQPSISSIGLSVAEPRNGAVNTADFVVRLSNPSVQSVSVNYSTSDGTARAGSDYTATSGTLTFAPLETVRTVKVQVLGDRDASEPTENFFLNFGGAQNGTVSTAQVSCSIVNNPTGGIATVADFDNDGKTDLSVFRPDGSTGGEWWGIRSSDNGVFSASFGTSSDRAVPADFTGDGKTDIAFFRPENGFWYVLRSEDNSFYGFPFGAMGDIPAPADFDGDGKADPTVFRPSLGAWFMLRSSDGGVASAQFGASGDRPIVADYDGDRKADIAIYRPNGASGGEWWISKSTGGVFAATFGTAADKPVPGDWTGDGKADCAFFRPSDHSWYILRSEDQSFYAFPYGYSTDIPAPGDYDGDGKMDAATFRPDIASWYINQSRDGNLYYTFGANGDQPVPGILSR